MKPWVVMSRRSNARIALAVLFASLFGPLYVAPRRAMAEIRVVTCCAGKCRQPLTARSARGCCEIAQAADDTAALTAVHGVAPPRAVAVLALVETDRLSDGRGVGHAHASSAGAQRAAPVFLLTRALRI